MLKIIKNFDDKNEKNQHISKYFDSIALLRHLIGDISNQRRHTMKNALKLELLNTMCIFDRDSLLAIIFMKIWKTNEGGLGKDLSSTAKNRDH